jgi:hypothetical protein
MRRLIPVLAVMALMAAMLAAIAAPAFANHKIVGTPSEKAIEGREK